MFSNPGLLLAHACATTAISFGRIFLGKMILLISICSNNPVIALLISLTSPLNEIRQPIFAAEDIKSAPGLQ